MKKSILTSAMAVAVASGAANAQVYDFVGTFTFYDASGTPAAPDTNVTGTFDLGNASGSFTSSQPFNGVLWTADVDTMFQYDPAGAATQSFNYAWTNKSFLVGGALESCRTGVQLDGCSGFTGTPIVSATNSYSWDMTNAGQFAAGVFFDWSVNNDIPVLATLQVTNDPATSGGVLEVISFDGDGDGVPGNKMITPPFPDQTAAFGGTMTPVPVPAAVWLFGSGLMGLVGVARRRRNRA